MGKVLRIALAVFSMTCAAWSSNSWADVVVEDDGGCRARPVADNRPSSGNVWTSMAQSFTAPASRISFGFRLFEPSGTPSQAGKPIIYNLYAGEISPLALLASRTVLYPATAIGVYCGAPDAGFVTADFSAAPLVIGQKYTIEVSLPVADLPAIESTAGILVRTNLTDLYIGGRFYFPVSPTNPVSRFNEFFVAQDMHFRITESGPAQQLAALQAAVASAGPGSSLSDKLNLAQGYLSVPDVVATCDILADFVSQVRAQSNKKLSAGLAALLISDAEAIRAALGCR